MTGIRPTPVVSPLDAPISDDELPGLFAMFAGRPLALAVSGGADSMALLQLVARWQRLRAVSSTPLALHHPSASPIIVLTVDHGLRSTSADEAAYVAAESRKLGFPCTLMRWSGEKPRSGVQEAARDARRSLFARALMDERRVLASSSDVAAIPPRLLVMAHNLEDQAETMLMRLGRGSGLVGLGAMHELSEIGEVSGCSESGDEHCADYLIARPFLGVSRRRLVATLQALGVRWIDDPSNENTAYERVRIRQALGVLEGLGISAASLGLSARRLRDAAEWLTHVEANCRAVEPDRHDIAWNFGVVADIRLTAGAGTLPRSYGIVRPLRQALATCGGAERLPQLSQIERLAEMIRSSHPLPPPDTTLGGCRVTFAAVRAGGFTIRIFREGEGLKSRAVACRAGESVAWDGGRYSVFAEAQAPAGATIRALGSGGWAELKRQVPALARLRWPSAAVATLPVVDVGGEAVAHPALDGAIQALPSDFAACQEVWRAFYCGPQYPGHFYQARFYRAEFEVRER